MSFESTYFDKQSLIMINFTLDSVMKEFFYLFRNQFFQTFTRDKKQLKFVLVSIRVSTAPEQTLELLNSRVSIIQGGLTYKKDGGGGGGLSGNFEKNP